MKVGSQFSKDSRLDKSDKSAFHLTSEQLPLSLHR